MTQCDTVKMEKYIREIEQITTKCRLELKLLIKLEERL